MRNTTWKPMLSLASVLNQVCLLIEFVSTYTWCSAACHPTASFELCVEQSDGIVIIYDS